VIKNGFVTGTTVDVDGGWLLGWVLRTVPTAVAK
jgi:hypothetical protein